MGVLVTHDPVLMRFRAALDEMYGDRIDRVVLFGSRARGDAHAESDYDVAVFLRSMPDRWAELDRLAELRLTFLGEWDAFFDTKPYLTETYFERTPLMGEIRRMAWICDPGGGAFSGQGSPLASRSRGNAGH